MLKCRDVPHQSEKLLAGELGFWQRLDLRIHLFICHPCRRYFNQLRVLLKSLPGLADKRTASDEEVRRAMDKMKDL